VPLPHPWESNRTALDDAAAVTRAHIPLERIRGPVLLISGTDDGSWPSARYSRMVGAALRAAGHRWPVRHLCYEGAEHSINPPFVPTTQIVRPYWVSGRVTTGGGTPAANAAGSIASWPEVLDFLWAAAQVRGVTLRARP
jgi:hypothetical protein